MRVYSEDEKCVIMMNLKHLFQFKSFVQIARIMMHGMILFTMKFFANIVEKYCE